MGQTLVEKIVQHYAVGLPAGHRVRSGEIVTIRPQHVMTHDNTGAVIPKFQSIGASRIADPHQPVYCLDHDVQNRSEKNLAKYAKIEAFAKEHDQLKVRLVSIGGKLLDPSELGTLAKMPTYEEAISQLMAVMKAPVQKLAATVNEVPGKLVRTIAAVRDAKEAA